MGVDARSGVAQHQKVDDKKRLPTGTGWDGDTPIGDPTGSDGGGLAPVSSESERARRLHPRAGTSPTGVPTDRATARAALGKIDELTRRFDEHAERDEAELGEINDKLDDQARVLDVLRGETAGMRGTLSVVSQDLQHARDLERIEHAGEEQRATLAEQKSLEQIKAAAEAWPWKAKVILAIIGVITAALAIVSTLLARR